MTIMISTNTISRYIVNYDFFLNYYKKLIKTIIKKKPTTTLPKPYNLI